MLIYSNSRASTWLCFWNCITQLIDIPFAIAPITTQMGSSVSGTISEGLETLSAVYDINNFLQPIGRWSVIGFLITFSNFIDESEALTENLWSNCTNSPAKRLNVLGIRVWGLTSISTLLAVWMYTYEIKYKLSRAIIGNV